MTLQTHYTLEEGAVSGGVTPPPEVWALPRDSLPTSREVGWGGQLHGETPHKHHLYQGPKSTPTVTNHVTVLYSSCNGMTAALYLCDLPPQTNNHSLIMRETSHECPSRSALRSTDQHSLKLPRPSKPRKV